MARRLKSANTISATATLHLDTTEMLAKVNGALLEATQDVFTEIEFSAAERSPVLAEATSARTPGENRDSIREKVRSAVSQHAEGVRARVFTTSGFGGYVELGTKKTRAQPYIYPAFEEHIGDLPDVVKEKLS
jgi:hypothetical protein